MCAARKTCPDRLLPFLFPYPRFSCDACLHCLARRPPQYSVQCPDHLGSLIAEIEPQENVGRSIVVAPLALLLPLPALPTHSMLSISPFMLCAALFAACGRVQCMARLAERCFPTLRQGNWSRVAGLCHRVEAPVLRGSGMALSSRMVTLLRKSPSSGLA